MSARLSKDFVELDPVDITGAGITPVNDKEVSTTLKLKKLLDDSAVDISSDKPTVEDFQTVTPVNVKDTAIVPAGIPIDSDPLEIPEWLPHLGIDMALIALGFVANPLVGGVLGFTRVPGMYFTIKNILQRSAYLGASGTFIRGMVMDDQEEPDLYDYVASIGSWVVMETLFKGASLGFTKGVEKIGWNALVGKGTAKTTVGEAPVQQVSKALGRERAIISEKIKRIEKNLPDSPRKKKLLEELNRRLYDHTHPKWIPDPSLGALGRSDKTFAFKANEEAANKLISVLDDGTLRLTRDPKLLAEQVFQATGRRVPLETAVSDFYTSPSVLSALVTLFNRMVPKGRQIDINELWKAIHAATAKTNIKSTDWFNPETKIISPGINELVTNYLRNPLLTRAGRLFDPNRPLFMPDFLATAIALRVADRAKDNGYHGFLAEVSKELKGQRVWNKLLGKSNPVTEAEVKEAAQRAVNRYRGIVALFEEFNLASKSSYAKQKNPHTYISQFLEDFDELMKKGGINSVDEALDALVKKHRLTLGKGKEGEAGLYYEGAGFNPKVFKEGREAMWQKTARSKESTDMSLPSVMEFAREEGRDFQLKDVAANRRWTWERLTGEQLAEREAWREKAGRAIPILEKHIERFVKQHGQYGEDFIGPTIPRRDFLNKVKIERKKRWSQLTDSQRKKLFTNQYNKLKEQLTIMRRNVETYDRVKARYQMDAGPKVVEGTGKYMEPRDVWREQHQGEILTPGVHSPLRGVERGEAAVFYDAVDPWISAVTRFLKANKGVNPAEVMTLVSARTSGRGDWGVSWKHVTPKTSKGEPVSAEFQRAFATYFWKRHILQSDTPNQAFLHSQMSNYLFSVLGKLHDFGRLMSKYPQNVADDILRQPTNIRTILTESDDIQKPLLQWMRAKKHTNGEAFLIRRLFKDLRKSVDEEGTTTLLSGWKQNADRNWVFRIDADDVNAFTEFVYLMDKFKTQSLEDTAVSSTQVLKNKKRILTRRGSGKEQGLYDLLLFKEEASQPAYKNMSEAQVFVEGLANVANQFRYLATLAETGIKRGTAAEQWASLGITRVESVFPVNYFRDTGEFVTSYRSSAEKRRVESFIRLNPEIVQQIKDFAKTYKDGEVLPIKMNNKEIMRITSTTNENLAQIKELISKEEFDTLGFNKQLVHLLEKHWDKKVSAELSAQIQRKYGEYFQNDEFIGLMSFLIHSDSASSKRLQQELVEAGTPAAGNPIITALNDKVLTVSQAVKRLLIIADKTTDPILKQLHTGLKKVGIEKSDPVEMGMAFETYTSTAGSALSMTAKIRGGSKGFYDDAVKLNPSLTREQFTIEEATKLGYKNWLKTVTEPERKQKQLDVYMKTIEKDIKDKYGLQNWLDEEDVYKYMFQHYPTLTEQGGRQFLNTVDRSTVAMLLGQFATTLRNVLQSGFQISMRNIGEIFAFGYTHMLKNAQMKYPDNFILKKFFPPGKMEEYLNKESFSGSFLDLVRPYLQRWNLLMYSPEGLNHYFNKEVGAASGALVRRRIPLHDLNRKDHNLLKDKGINLKGIYNQETKLFNGEVDLWASKDIANVSQFYEWLSATHKTIADEMRIISSDYNVLNQASHQASPFFVGTKDIAGSIRSVARFLNILNAQADYSIRRFVFFDEFVKQAAKRGHSVEQMMRLKDDKVILDTLAESLTVAAESTFSVTPVKDSFNGRMISFFQRQIESGPIPFAFTSLIPFPRFLYNTFRILAKYNPIKMLNLVRLHDENAVTKYVKGDTEPLIEAMTSLGILATVGGLYKAYGKGKYNELVIDTDKGPRALDLKPFTPMTGWFLLYHLINSHQTGAPLGLTFKEGMKAFTGIEARAKNLPTWAFDLFTDISEHRMGKVTNNLGVALGDIAGRPLQTLNMVGDFLAASDELVTHMPFGVGDVLKDTAIHDAMEDVASDFNYMSRSMGKPIGGVLSKVPLPRTLPREDWPDYHKYELFSPDIPWFEPSISQKIKHQVEELRRPKWGTGLKGKMMERKWNLSKQVLGLSLYEPKTPIEYEVDRLHFQLKEIIPRTGIPEWDDRAAERISQHVPMLNRLVEGARYKDLPSDNMKKIMLKKSLAAVRENVFAELKHFYPKLWTRKQFKKWPREIQIQAIREGLAPSEWR